MRWMKKLLPALLLCLLTVGVILLPPAWDARAGAAGGRTVWSYEAGTAAEITDREVAQLYCSGEIDPYNFTNGDQADDAYRQETCHMLERVFADSSDQLLQTLKTVATDGKPTACLEKTVVTLWNGRPVALRLVEVGFLADDTYLMLSFETRTLTLLFLESNAVSSDLAELDGHFSEVHEAADSYFAGKLGLNSSQYSFDNNNRIAAGTHIYPDVKNDYYWSTWLQWYSDVKEVENDVF